MRIFFLPLFLLFVFVSTAQDFRGYVKYEMYADHDSSFHVVIDTWYGDQKIFFQTTVKNTKGLFDLKNERILLNFKDSTIDRIHPENKAIERQRLKPVMQLPAPVPDSIQGASSLKHPVTRYVLPAIILPASSTDSMQKTSVQLRVWYADDIFFHVPVHLKYAEMVPLFTNGNLAMGSDLKISGAQNISLTTIATVLTPLNRKKTDKKFKEFAGYKVKFKD